MATRRVPGDTNAFILVSLLAKTEEVKVISYQTVYFECLFTCSSKLKFRCNPLDY